MLTCNVFLDFYLIDEFFMAACELKRMDWAQFFLQMTRKEFPKSVKVMRMLAIMYEAQGEIVKAQEIYLDMIDANPADAQTVKRLVCVFRDMEMYSSAISVLNKYVEVN